MKLNKYALMLPLALATAPLMANESEAQKPTKPVFHFSAQVERIVEQDLMSASVYSRKEGKNLAPIKKQVSSNLNTVIEAAQKHPSIEVVAEGITNNPSYNSKGKVIGWEAHGNVFLKSKDFDAMAKVLENLNDEIAIDYINFSISPEKAAEIEDQITLEAVQKFQHKAEIVRKGLNAKSFTVGKVELGQYFPVMTRQAPVAYAMAEARDASAKSVTKLPLAAGKESISTTATGWVSFE
ncbi:hypothetical protein A4G20_05300 [Pasteurellaceae bacterium RH1A]|nr:hypothetical protein A4G20_05300 [Pasteurellaceae bacterium RH1A]